MTDLRKLFPIKTTGEYVSDWANETFGPNFSANKFRDGSAFAPPQQERSNQSIRIIIEIPSGT